MVVDGEATVFLDGEIIKLSIAESIYVPKGSKHRLENNTNKELQVIKFNQVNILVKMILKNILMTSEE